MSNEVPFKVRWLSGGIPDHWKIVEPRRIFKLVKEPERPGDIHLTPSQKYGVLPQEEYMKITGAGVVQNLSGTQMQHVEPGDFISHLRTFQGGLELATMPGKVSPAYTVLRPSEAVYPGFFKHVLKSPGYISQIASVTDQLRDGQTMRYNEFNLTWLPLPPLDEQKKIADELDRELAEIDEFIAEQIKLKELLKEQFEAQKEKIILESDGQKVRLSRVLKGIKDGTHGTHPRVDSGGEVLLSAKNISSGELVISEDESRISLEEAAQITASGFPRKGDVMMILVGATYGRTARYNLDQTLPFQRSVGFFRPNNDLITSDYLKLAMSSRDFQHQLSLGIKTSAQPGIYLNDVSSCTIRLPTLKNQLSATKHFTTLNKDYSNLGSNINQTINLLKERKKSTIQNQIIHKHHTLISKYQ